MAHRGDMVHAPENTLPAFRLAIEAGCDLLETDLRFTRDGHLVCHHDATARRMTGDPRAIGEMTLAELRELRVAAGHPRFPGEPIPGLEDLLRLTPPDVVLALELKDPTFAYLDGCRSLVDAIAERIAARTVIAVSFHLDRLHAVRRLAPEIAIGHITPGNPLPCQDADMVGPYYPVLLMNPWYVQMAHARGKWACVLDNRLHDHLAAYLRMGFDSVLSDDPARTRRLIDELRR